jgi:glycosyltransferase involved in cell wall biosynthesis
MIRIASLITELGYGGDENRVLSFARHLDRSRFAHTVITVVDSDAAGAARIGPMAERYREAGVRCLTLGEPRRADRVRLPPPISQLHDAARLARIAARLARLLARERIDVVDARTTYMMVVGLLAARLANVPAAIATEYSVPFWSRAPWRWIAPAVFDGFDALISDSRWAVERWRADLGRPLAHAVVVPNGIPAPESDRDRAGIRSELGIPPRARVIAQIARIVRYKGQLTLLEAAARVIREEPDVYVLICGYDGGDPQLGAELPRRVAARGLGHRVRITPWPRPVAEVWRAVDIHAHPSLLDSSPIAIHESMALGLPAVVSSAGGIPELVDDDRTALVVPPGDSGALATALLRLLREPETAARLGAAARQRYLERHRPEQMTRALEALIEEVLLRKRGPVLAAVGA